ncbi:MAG: molecular chaperone SurA [Burkholderiales bacterium RIFOXYC2_FULL_59_8]|nr:MAG: molecular chaperone SurA [Burkholderiales bacterium RIFOXYC2_FULL_59_8]OGB50698.1 MAG: molecular chaperone SurA [Burkholderiales bacterium RIFOXYD12_FULL_59_19]OGB82899.1 MAG: molecular chaperone SurA [Burkholderiales bacterium RIFOXYC12_FULL_60_6]OGB84401.1 MAG: molecular chaperone SurA [Burkholderiales bacterium RIFOXYD2_FULL_59_8]
MTFSFKFLSGAVLACLLGAPAQAQGLRLPPTAGAASTVTGTATSDFIVAVVNSAPITNAEVQREVLRVQQQYAAQRRSPPELQRLTAETLERLINQKVLLQFAFDTGIKAEDTAVDLATQSIAAQNQLTLAQLYQQVAADGLSAGQFRAQLRDQILLQRLRERDLEPRVRVTDLDIDAYLQAQQNTQDLSKLDINLAQVLIAVPESATGEQVQALQEKARKVLERARAGDDFATLVRDFSDPTAQANGGQLGLRSADRYPDSFVEATRQLAPGEVANLVRSLAGFHILKVVEKVNVGLPAMSVTQSHTRHILLRPSAQLSEAQARARLLDFKKQLQAGQADFAALAREHSQDGSAAQGGDLGWASPGMFVPEFESVMNQLAPGEVSEPLLSRFGLHLVQLLERRQAKLSQAEQRESVRALLREKKLAEAMQTWTQEMRGRAYVELRDAPL